MSAAKVTSRDATTVVRNCGTLIACVQWRQRDCPQIRADTHNREDADTTGTLLSFEDSEDHRAYLSTCSYAFVEAKQRANTPTTPGRSPPRISPRVITGELEADVTRCVTRLYAHNRIFSFFFFFFLKINC